MNQLLRPVSAWVCVLFLLIATVGPWLVSRSPESIDLAHAFELPSRAHWLARASKRARESGDNLTRVRRYAIWRSRTGVS